MDKVDVAVKYAANKTRQFNSDTVNHAGYDKTFIGEVIDGNETTWTIYANATTYIIPIANCNATNVGQNVRVFVPNNNTDTIYAEVTTDNANCEAITVSNSSVVFDYDDNTAVIVNLTRDSNNKITSFTLGGITTEVNYD